MKLQTKNEENYSAKFVELTEFAGIPGANTIQQTFIFGNSVIVSKDSKPGDRGIFFPVECQISADFVSKNNLHQDKNLNADQTKSGYFNEKRRVRCVKFMKVPSEGFFCPLSYIETWLGIKEKEWSKVKLNTSFDTINNVELGRKYFIKQGGLPSTPGRKKGKKAHSRIIREQARLHYDTSKFAENIHLFDLDDEIVISNKLHGCQFGMARVLVKRKLSFSEKVKKFFRFKVQETEYDDLYFSRAVFKNAYQENSQPNHYYKEDVWKIAFNKYRGVLTEGVSLYGELVAYTSTGGYIQKGYDYGFKPGEQEVYFYRGTDTDAKGNVTEWPMEKLISFCNERGLKHVPIFYSGKVRDLYKGEVDPRSWRSEWLKQLKSSFNLEKNCEMCKNPVEAEGVCIRNETKKTHAFKLKSFKFLCKETEMLDKGEIDMESQEVVNSSTTN